MNEYRSFALVLALFSVFMVSFAVNSAAAAPTIVPCTGTGTLTCGFINVANTTLDVGQNSIITINGISGGAPGANGYTANWILDGFPDTPRVDNNIFTNTIVFEIVPSATLAGNVFVYNGILSPANFVALGPYNEGSNIYTVNAAITDQPGANSIVTNDIPLITVNTALGTPSAPTENASGLDLGQKVSFSTSVSGGTTPYTYNFIISKYIGASPGPVVAYSGPQASNTFSYTTTQTGSFLENVVVTDNASTPETTNSPYGPIGFAVVNDPVVSLIPNKPSFDSGQTITYNIIVTNGINPYRAELYNVTGSKQQGSNVIIYTSGSGNTISFTAGSAGTLQYKAIVTDSASSNYTVISATNTIKVSAIPTVTLTASNSILDIGQVQSLTLTFNGGSLPFRGNVLYANNSTVLCGSTVLSGNTTVCTFPPVIAGTFSYKVVATDGSGAPVNSHPICAAFSC